jgi:hypothetical protein
LVRDERLTFVEYLQDEKKTDGEILNPVSEKNLRIYMKNLEALQTRDFQLWLHRTIKFK